MGQIALQGIAWQVCCPWSLLSLISHLMGFSYLVHIHHSFGMPLSGPQWVDMVLNMICFDVSPPSRANEGHSIAWNHGRSTWIAPTWPPIVVSGGCWLGFMKHKLACSEGKYYPHMCSWGDSPPPTASLSLMGKWSSRWLAIPIIWCQSEAP